jgi:hypothetical protein
MGVAEPPITVGRWSHTLLAIHQTDHSRGGAVFSGFGFPAFPFVFLYKTPDVFPYQSRGLNGCKEK